MSAPEPVAGERVDLLQSLARQRHFLRYTTRGLTDEQAAQRTTASGLCLGGLIKHVALTEQQWMRFIVDGPAAMSWDEGSAGDWMAAFRMVDGETLGGLLENYAQVARRTEELVTQLPDLDAAHPVPPGALVRARRPLVGAPGAALLQVIAETAQHAGHADIIRESLDGAKSMG